jgi:hypothetical protein
MSEPRPQLPPFTVAVDDAAPCGNVLRPLAALLLAVARRRLAGRKQPQPEPETVPKRGRHHAGRDV